MTNIGNAYAQALYSLCAEEGLTKVVLDELLTLDRAFLDAPDFIRLLSSPSLSKEERTGIVERSFRGKLTPYLLNFLKILVEKGYIRHFSACCEAFRAQYNTDNNILPVKAITAVPLAAEQAARLTAKLARMTEKQIELTNEVDPACLGGVRLDYDGMRVDGTVLQRLNAVRDLLKNTVL